MKYFIAIGAAVGLAIVLPKLGIPPYVTAALALTAMIFWQRVMGFVVGMILAVSKSLAPKGQPGVPWLDNVARWLVAEEMVASMMVPEDVDNLRISEAELKAERDAHARDVAAKKAQKVEDMARSEQVFHELATPVTFLVRQQNGRGAAKSKIGGRPSLPDDDFVWPSRDSVPYHFIAELHLEEVPRDVAPADLPSEGVLYFFGCLDDDFSDGTVVYAPHTGKPVRLPKELQELPYGFQSGDHPGLLIENPIRPTVLPYLNPDDINYDEYTREFTDALRSRDEKIYKARVKEASVKGQAPLVPSDHYKYHMIGGPKSSFPNPTDGTGVKLLQLDSDDGLGLQFGDMGILEFWIDPDDLAQGLFENATMTASSC